MSSLRPWPTCHFGPFFWKNCDQVLGARDRAVRPLAGRRALDERLVDGGRERVGGERGGAEGERPLGADDALGGDALAEVEPGDLGGERVEDRLAPGAQRLEGPEELVAAAVAAADGAEPRVAGSVLLHPGQAADQPDQVPHVAALVGGVLDVRLAAALAEAALVERQHAVPGVQPLLERRRVGGARPTPAVAVHDHRDPVCAVGTGRTEQRVADLDRLGGARLGHARDAAVGDRGGPHGSCTAACAVGTSAGSARTGSAAARRAPAATAMRSFMV